MPVHSTPFMHATLRRTLALALAATLAGCVNLHQRIDGDPGPDGTPVFSGLRDHFRNHEALHLVQVHGMGMHTAPMSCSAGGINVGLQRALARELEMVEIAADAKAQPIVVGSTHAGTYTTRLFAGRVDGQDRRLYASCITWSETSRAVKLRMLELKDAPGRKDDFHEQNPNERHRAPLNRYGKRFVNRSLSDPVLYAGPFGGFIRETVWAGMQQVRDSHVRLRTRALKSMADAEAGRASMVAAQGDGDPADMPTVVLSDSLGSRIVFDTLCARQDTCGGRPPTLAATVDAETRAVAGRITASIRSVYMLANQLPLMELATLQAPADDVPLSTHLSQIECGLPMSAAMEAKRRDDPVEIVAFTDPNDLLSYHLGEDFRRRCGQGLRIVNVTTPNARLRWLFVATDPAKAHSSGFKGRGRVREWLIEGSSSER